MNNIFVTGGIWSGKTYLSKSLSKSTNMTSVSLDDIFFDLSSEIHRKKREDIPRNEMLCEYVNQGNLIFEGWHFGDWLVPLYKSLKLLIIVDTPIELRKERIKKRFEDRKSGKEEDPFPNGGKEHLVNLLKWTELFDVTNTQKEIKRHCSSSCIFLQYDGYGDIVSKVIQQIDLH